MKNTFIFCALIAMLGACADEIAQATLLTQESQQDAILNGYLATEEESPEVGVLISFTESEGIIVQGSMCTGTLIAPKVVLTAAHCVPTEDTQKIHPSWHSTVTFSTTAKTFQWSSSWSIAKKWVVHENYLKISYGQHDIALVFLNDALHTPVATLPNHELEQSDVSNKVELVGYGRYGYLWPTYGTKRKGTSYIYDMSPWLIKIAGWPLAAQACFGDSGAPIYASVGEQRTLIGIASTVEVGILIPCNNGFYTRVDKHLAWIEEQLQQARENNENNTNEGAEP